MKLSLSFALLVLLFSAAALSSSAQDEAAGKTGASDAPKARSRILIISGADVPAHDWRATTPQTRAQLEESDELEVFLCEDAAILATEALHRYAAVVLNYRNPPNADPGEAARENLARFVQAGGGLVVIHFGVYAFSGWDEYEKMIGRVWVGRRSGEKVSGHGERGRFEVSIKDIEHPITQGLKPFEADDELYSKLVGDEPIRVLLDAHSDWSQAREPIAWVKEYGKGRVFVTVLGHDTASRSVPEFATVLRRGAEWVVGRSE